MTEAGKPDADGRAAFSDRRLPSAAALFSSAGSGPDGLFPASRRSPRCRRRRAADVGRNGRRCRPAPECAGSARRSMMPGVRNDAGRATARPGGCGWERPATAAPDRRRSASPGRARSANARRRSAAIAPPVRGGARGGGRGPRPDAGRRRPCARRAGRLRRSADVVPASGTSAPASGRARRARPRHDRAAARRRRRAVSPRRRADRRESAPVRARTDDREGEPRGDPPFGVVGTRKRTTACSVVPGASLRTSSGHGLVARLSPRTAGATRAGVCGAPGFCTDGRAGL